MSPVADDRFGAFKGALTGPEAGPKGDMRLRRIVGKPRN
jgi:hypothetical protein